MPDRIAPYIAHIDGNQVPTSMGVVGTQGTADTGGTAYSLPASVDPTTGAWYVNDIGTNSAFNLTSGTINAGTITIPGTVAVEDRFSYAHLSGAGTTVAKSGAGLLHSLVINAKSVGGNLTLFDNTAASGGTIAVIDTTLSTTAFVYDISFTTGLTAAWAGNTGGDVTIGYR